MDLLREGEFTIPVYYKANDFASVHWPRRKSSASLEFSPRPKATELIFRNLTARLYTLVLKYTGDFEETRQEYVASAGRSVATLAMSTPSHPCWGQHWRPIKYAARRVVLKKRRRPHSASGYRHRRINIYETLWRISVHFVQRYKWSYLRFSTVELNLCKCLMHLPYVYNF